MARVTVEDCIEKVDNRFDLVILAAHRTRQISAGAPLTVERDKDKNPVIALREIAEGTVPVTELMDGVLSTFKPHTDIEPEEEELAELLEQELASAHLKAIDSRESLDELSDDESTDLGNEDVESQDAPLEESDNA